MRGRARGTALAAPAALVALLGMLLAPACDKNDPTALSGSSIILSASPSALPSTGGFSDINAVLLDPNGIPADGVAVYFSTTEGSLDSQSIGVTTDSNGIARDRLTTTQSAQVTAQSGDTSAQVTVTVGGQQIVGSINLTSTPQNPCGQAPLGVEFTATVLNTNNVPLSGVFLSVNVTPSSGVQIVPTVPVTDANGIARFDVETIGTDGTTVSVSVGSVSSNVITVKISTTCP